MLRRFPRVDRAELMDQPDVEPALLEADLRNLSTLNQLFGGRAVLRRHLPALLRELPPRELVLLDVASGAGDLCRTTLEVCRALGRPVKLLSLDAHAGTQAFARAHLSRHGAVRFIRADARRLPLRSSSVDGVLCTLALHHFPEDEAVSVLSEMRRVTRGWALVSDLCRSRTAYAAVWAATRATPNPLTRHDGPVSVRRAYTAPELQGLAERAGWGEARFFREPWFRMSLVYGENVRW